MWALVSEYEFYLIKEIFYKHMLMCPAIQLTVTGYKKNRIKYLPSWSYYK